jgi:hypothetical protein
VRRMIRCILTYLVLGAATTVALAWIFALALPLQPSDQIRRGHTGMRWPCWDVTTYASPTTTVLTGRPVISSLDTADRSQRQSDRWVPTYFGFMHQPFDMLEDIPPEFNNLPDFEGADHRRRVVETHGWPMRALRAVIEYEFPTWADEYDGVIGNASSITTSSALRLPSLSAKQKREVHDAVVPFEIVPLGLTVDALLFGTTWFLLITGRSMTVIRLRRFRGRCARCGYDLRGNVSRGCPECGWNRHDEAHDGARGHGT